MVAEHAGRRLFEPVVSHIYFLLPDPYLDLPSVRIRSKNPPVQRRAGKVSQTLPISRRLYLRQCRTFSYCNRGYTSTKGLVLHSQHDQCRPDVFCGPVDELLRTCYP